MGVDVDGIVGGGTKMDSGTFGWTAGVGGAGRVGSIGVGTPGPGVVGTSGVVGASVGGEVVSWVGGPDGPPGAWPSAMAGRTTTNTTSAAVRYCGRRRKPVPEDELKRAVAAR